jgi:hypothetical protein
MWQQWERFGVLPALGGWMCQPLSLLIQIKAVDMAYNTAQYIDNGGDMAKLSETQRELWRFIGG